MTTAIIRCGQLATLAGPARPRIGPEMRELGLISDGGMLIQDGVIQALGTTDEILAMTTSETTVWDAQGRLVTPGFVDAHTHAVFAGNRANEFEMRSQGKSYQEISASGGGIKKSVRSTREATETELANQSEDHLHWMLRCGTTTLEIKSGYGLDLETELKMLRVAKDLGPQRVVTTFLGAHAVPPEANSRSEYLELVLNEILPVVVSENLASFADMFVEENYFSHDDARRLAQKGLPLRLHVDQFTDKGGAALAAEIGAKTADHLEQTGIEGIRAMVAKDVMPVLLPASVFGLGLSKYPDARLMIEEGLPVVLATDFNPGSSPSPSLPFTMSLACTQMKMDPAEGLSACTINAAYSLNLGFSVGSLEPGKSADFVVHDVSDYREIPYWSGRETARIVFVKGHCVFKS